MTALLISVAAKGLLVLAVAFGLLALLRGAPPALRHGIWTAAFAALLILPALNVLAPAWTVPILPTAASSAVSNVLIDIDDTVIVCDDAFECGPVAATEAPVWLSGDAAAPSDIALWDHLDHAHSVGDVHEMAVIADGADHVWTKLTLGGVGLWLLAIWALGALAVLVRWAAAYAAAMFVVRGAVPVTDEGWLDSAERARRLLGIDADVRVLVSDRLGVPVAWGWGTPAVVLPPDADGWDEDRRDAVLLHELAHVRRGDARTGLVAHLALALHWPNPLAWLAYRRFLVEREHACDDAVLSGGATPSAYAGHLVDIARGAGGEPRALAALAPMARVSDLEGRVVAVLDAGRRRVAAGRSGLVRAVALGLVVAAPLGVLHPVAAEAPADALAWLGDADIVETPMEDPMEPVEAAGLEMDALDESVDVADEAEAVEALRDTIPLAEDVIGPARESTLAQVRRLRAEGRGLDDDAWDEIEREVEDAFDGAHQNYQDIVDRAVSQAFESDAVRDALRDTGVGSDAWRAQIQESLRAGERGRQAGLRAADAERQRALATASRTRDNGLRQADRIRREALKEAQQDREEAQRDREEALREAQREREHSHRDAQRERQESLREAERERRESLREAQQEREEARREAERERQREPRGRSSRSQSHSHSHSTTSSTTISSGRGPSALSVGTWMMQADALDHALDGLERAAADLPTAPAARRQRVWTLRAALTGVDGGLTGLAHTPGWPASASERRIARDRLAAPRARVAALDRRLENG